MKSKKACFCIPSLKKKSKPVSSEEEKSSSHPKPRGKSRRNVTTDAFRDHDEASHGTTGPTNTSSVDAGAAAAVMGAAYAMGGSACGSSHGGGGDG